MAIKIKSAKAAPCVLKTKATIAPFAAIKSK